MVVLFLFVLLGMAAMVIDVGYAFYAQRALQAQVDAAALAD
jgi:Flp pilus assembly protein TadG